jgi:hypothetical protein
LISKNLKWVHQLLLINKDEITQIWQNLVYPARQVNNNNLEITLKSVHTFEGRGQLDFGGGEYLETKQQEIAPELENDPKYGFNMNPDQLFPNC